MSLSGTPGPTEPGEAAALGGGGNVDQAALGAAAVAAIFATIDAGPDSPYDSLSMAIGFALLALLGAFYQPLAVNRRQSKHVTVRWARDIAQAAAFALIAGILTATALPSRSKP